MKKISKELQAALKVRDAEWRDALRGNFAPEFWRQCGPQDPKQAAIFQREGDRVNSEWREWMIKRLERTAAKLRAVRKKKS